ncbi:MAG: AAA family ATPase [Defluviitaleaceae bacterium]|nr:AAA family ATPase [Defluviitaleaceae bacterium]
MITKLELKNFRCFEDFTFDGIRPVTLIAGENNVGKSALLESVCLFMGRNTPQVFNVLNDIRGLNRMPFTPYTVWESLFSNYNTNEAINIRVVFDGTECLLSLSSGEALEFDISDSDFGDTLSMVENYPLKVQYIENDTENNFNYILLREGRIAIEREGRKYRKYRSHLLSRRLHRILPNYLSTKLPISTSRIANLLDSHLRHGTIGKIVDILNIFDNRVKDLLITSTNGIPGVAVDLGLPVKLPINILGDGINKLLGIILSMFSNPDGILLIDEIENGFHYSFFPKLWEIIGKLTIETGCQVFATTHSSECIDGSLKLATSSENPDLFRFVRLDRVEGVVVPKIFSNDSFEYAVNNNWEVR